MAEETSIQEWISPEVLEMAAALCPGDDRLNAPSVSRDKLPASPFRTDAWPKITRTDPRSGAFLGQTPHSTFLVLHLPPLSVLLTSTSFHSGWEAFEPWILCLTPLTLE